MGEFGRLTFICSLGIPKRSGVSQLRFQMAHVRWSGYIVWMFGELWSSNSIGVFQLFVRRRHCYAALCHTFL